MHNRGLCITWPLFRNLLKHAVYALRGKDYLEVSQFENNQEPSRSLFNDASSTEKLNIVE